MAKWPSICHFDGKRHPTPTLASGRNVVSFLGGILPNKDGMIVCVSVKGPSFL